MTKKTKTTTAPNAYAVQAAAIRSQAAKHKDPKVRAAINAQAAIVEKLGKGAPAK
jgi:hypothetical protein